MRGSERHYGHLVDTFAHISPVSHRTPKWRKVVRVAAELFFVRDTTLNNFDDHGKKMIKTLLILERKLES